MTSNQRNDGRGFQNDIKTICAIYNEQGRGYFEKIDPPVRVLGFGTNRKVIFQPNPFLDFVGVWTENGGRPLFFEAKSTLWPTLDAGGDRSLTVKQIDAMRKWREAGAGSFLLWEYKGEVRLFFLLMIETGLTERKSLVFDDGLRVQAGKGFIFYDFLTEIKKYPDLL